MNNDPTNQIKYSYVVAIISIFFAAYSFFIFLFKLSLLSLFAFISVYIAIYCLLYRADYVYNYFRIHIRSCFICNLLLFLNSIIFFIFTSYGFLHLLNNLIKSINSDYYSLILIFIILFLGCSLGLHQTNRYIGKHDNL